MKQKKHQIFKKRSCSKPQVGWFASLRFANTIVLFAGFYENSAACKVCKCNIWSPPHITYKWICWILFLRSFEATTSQHKVTPSLETTNVWWLWFNRRGHHCLSSSFAMKAFLLEPKTLSRLFERSQDKITSSYFYHTNPIFLSNNTERPLIWRRSAAVLCVTWLERTGRSRASRRPSSNYDGHLSLLQQKFRQILKYLDVSAPNSLWHATKKMLIKVNSPQKTRII